MATSLRIHIEPRSSLRPAWYAEVVALCTRAYEEPFGETMAAFGNATHVLGFAGAELVSHALWIPRTLTADGAPLSSAYVEAVATEAHHRGRGYGSAVLRALAGAITSFDLGALSPSDPAFYARLGWERWRGPLGMATDGGIVPTPGEQVMILRLPGTPPLDLDGTLIAPWRAGEVW